MNARKLCNDLLYAETETTVVKTLKDAGYWDDPAAWRPYGDLENNYGTIGNQQSEAVAALVEKIVNAIDARLANECLKRGEDPASADAPQSIREAVHRYFGGGGSFDPDRDGRLSNWPDARLNAEGDYITVAATGGRPEGRGGSRNARPCLTISDNGEGQTPDDFPDTFLSLHRNNKIGTHFVQGKFNMGATGALPYCSERYNLQLIVSRRNPALLNGNAARRAGEWGFTVVRRQPPTKDSRSSVFQYLAPLNAQKDKYGDVLSFPADAYPIFPDRKGAYSRNSPHGSLVKLYEYHWRGTNSNVLMPGDGGGLIRRIEIALAEPALPVKLYECRGYSGHANFRGVRGILTDLERNPEDLEPGFPQSADLSVGRNRVKIGLYVFQPDAYQSHRTAQHGVLFLYNGQLHAAYPTRFFRRQSVRKSYLANDLLVTVDCSRIDRRDFEELFMNSRDRLRTNSPMAVGMESKLADFLYHDAGLRALDKGRRDAAIAGKYKNDAARTDLLKEILTNNPDISRYLLKGSAIAQRGRGPHSAPSSQFVGRQFPTYFKPRRQRWRVGAGRTVTVEFETDAENNYFDRKVSPGRWSIADGDGADWTNCWDRTGPTGGIARFRWDTGDSLAAIGQPGDTYDFTWAVSDESRIEPLESRATVSVIEPIIRDGGDNRKRRDNIAELLDGLNIIEVREKDWADHPLGKFDGRTQSASRRTPLTPGTGKRGIFT